MKGGAKVGVLQVRLYRPFPIARLLEALPASVRTIAVLDRTKEPGATGEPLYLDVVTALAEGVARGTRATMPRVVGGRYGLSSKEFTPAMVKAVFDEIDTAQPRTGFTVGITDDVNGTSLDVDETFTTEPDDVFRAVFYGLGADGTVGANKNTIKIIGEDPDVHVQAYFVYDSKKSGSQTVSHLRFGPRPIRSTYLVREAQFIGCHQFQFIEKVDVLALAAKGATLLLNSPHDASQVWDYLPRPVQDRIVERRMAVWVIDANKVARAVGLGSHTNSVLQTCFFAVSGVLPREKAIEKIKKAIAKTYRSKGKDVVRKNFEAVDRTIEALTSRRGAGHGHGLAEDAPHRGGRRTGVRPRAWCPRSWPGAAIGCR